MVAILVMWPGPFEQTFVPPFQRSSAWNLISFGLAVIVEKKLENIESEWLRPRLMNDLYLW